jgi:hypothetical protein
MDTDELFPPDQPIVIAYGGGRDSTAAIIEMHRRGIRIDVILMADTGNEKPETYLFLVLFNCWLRANGLPEITFVQYVPAMAPYHTLEGNMVLNATLPGIVFNRHTCAQKFKIQPQDSFIRGWTPAQRAWAHGRKVTKVIGFLAEEEYRLKRADARAHAGAFSPEQGRYDFRFPLMAWGMDLAACIRTITRAGLPVPPKSSCYFCPSMKPDEVLRLSPLERALIILQELSAEPYNTKVHGLWRRPRKHDGRPGSMTEFILQQDLEFVPLTDICTRVVLNPNCNKARVGYSLRPEPAHRPRDLWLSEQLREHGHRVPAILLSGDAAAQDAFRDMHILDRVQSVLEGTAHARMAAEAAAALGIGGRPARALPVLHHQTSLFEASPCDAPACGIEHPSLCAA